MAVFSRITASVILACTLLASASDVQPKPALAARQPHRAHARSYNVHNTSSRSAKRAAAKKRVCAAKTTTSVVSSTKTTTTTHHATTTKPAAVSNGGGGSSSGGKLGLAWNDGPSSFMKPFISGGASWCYTWSAWTCCNGDNCPDWYPQMWGEKSISQWQDQVMGKHFKSILGFNEPDQSGQSAMSVSDGISLWWKYMEPVNADFKVSPAVTASPGGIKWIQDFMDGCNGCNIGAVAFHFYGMDADAFISTCNNFHKMFPGKEIWVTEWACQNYGSNPDNQCSLSDVQAFMAKTQGFLNGASWVGKYAWFGALTQFPGGFNTLNRLITSGGSMTDLGYQYINA